MLESAITKVVTHISSVLPHPTSTVYSTQSTDSVSLDLLTYSDLEALRNRKLGGRVHSPAKGGRQLHAKRYLILTYSVEFDRYEAGR